MAKRPKKSATRASAVSSLQVDDPPERWTRKSAEAHMRQQIFRCRPITDAERPRYERMNGDERMAFEAVLQKRCGADLTDIMASVPYDSQVHKGKCPKCGHPFDWRAPWYPGVDGIGPDGPEAA